MNLTKKLRRSVVLLRHLVPSPIASHNTVDTASTIENNSAHASEGYGFSISISEPDLDPRNSKCVTQFFTYEFPYLIFLNASSDSKHASSAKSLKLNLKYYYDKILSANPIDASSPNGLIFHYTGSFTLTRSVVNHAKGSSSASQATSVLEQIPEYVMSNTMKAAVRTLRAAESGGAPSQTSKFDSIAIHIAAEQEGKVQAISLNETVKYILMLRRNAARQNNHHAPFCLVLDMWLDTSLGLPIQQEEAENHLRCWVQDVLNKEQDQTGIYLFVNISKSSPSAMTVWTEFCSDMVTAYLKYFVAPKLKQGDLNTEWLDHFEGHYFLKNSPKAMLYDTIIQMLQGVIDQAWKSKHLGRAPSKSTYHLIACHMLCKRLGATSSLMCAGSISEEMMNYSWKELDKVVTTKAMQWRIVVKQ